MEDAYLSGPNAHIRYLDLPGREPTLVFVPGAYLAGTAAFVPVATAPRFADRRRVIVDLLGGGYSDRPVDFGYRLQDHAESVAAILDGLNVDGATLIGHSLGGAVSILLAHSRPDLVARLVLLEANLDPGGGPFSQFVTGFTEEAFVSEGLEGMLADLRASASKGDEGAVAFLGTIQTIDATALHRSCVDVIAERSPTVRETLLDLDIPRVYLFGEHSLPDEDYDVLPAQGVSVAVVPEAGHGMTRENPAGLAKAILPFIDP